MTLTERAYAAYLKLCPYAPKLDKSVDPPVQFPPEKSITQQAYILGYNDAKQEMIAETREEQMTPYLEQYKNEPEKEKTFRYAFPLGYWTGWCLKRKANE